ncbi:hypothetical protein YIM_23350 [Amycolatopsis sp. YIM 10]|nr:hypothetical protein YIM_23350 [Amycolatopsis sp. YIM 10]
MLFGSFWLLAYAAAAWAVPAAFVRWYEEPTFGAGYEEYRRAVPAWLPRLRPWTRTRTVWSDHAHPTGSTSIPAHLSRVANRPFVAGFRASVASRKIDRSEAGVKGAR